MTPEEQLEGISDVCQKLVARQYRYLKVLLQELESEGLYFIHPDEASPEQKKMAGRIFRTRDIPGSDTYGCRLFPSIPVPRLQEPEPCHAAGKK